MRPCHTPELNVQSPHYHCDARYCCQSGQRSLFPRAGSRQDGANRYFTEHSGGFGYPVACSVGVGFYEQIRLKPEYKCKQVVRGLSSDLQEVNGMVVCFARPGVAGNFPLPQGGRRVDLEVPTGL